VILPKTLTKWVLTKSLLCFHIISGSGLTYVGSMIKTYLRYVLTMLTHAEICAVTRLS
jgi:hypothetical protein